LRLLNSEGDFNHQLLGAEVYSHFAQVRIDLYQAVVIARTVLTAEWANKWIGKPEAASGDCAIESPEFRNS
jgi:hypothetical protein